MLEARVTSPNSRRPTPLLFNNRSIFLRGHNESDKSSTAAVAVPTAFGHTKMGNVLSAFGFNQPFLYALLGIIIVLSLTAVCVADVKPANNGLVYQDAEWERPKITIHSPFLNPLQNERTKTA
ncbi:hypothetical protein QR680_015928 [Steinernema hermaphroditum]|uniref:Transmembrane protein n=1 Tax=Steinernema hermaphroditum TaxID=289476 RepID=A0AA39LLQ8_9BILA|nr:hypothetical protein QR680_015928 [Steinernema hermaphroditum]